MTYNAGDHTFCVCAYKESVYLEKCIRSLLAQRVRGKILIATSTPNAYIDQIARRYEIPIYVNPVSNGIAGDWNYAYSKADTPLVTIAHQDDIYDKGYLESVLKAVNKVKKPILIHTMYYEIRDGKPVYSNKLLNIKKIMLIPFLARFTWNSIFVRRRILSIGNAICCPSVTYVRPELPPEPFEPGTRADLDWDAWERFSKKQGAFCYVRKQVMGHRVHEESETTSVIGDGGGRTTEDLDMYRRFWPEPIARFLVKLYSTSQNSNQL